MKEIITINSSGINPYKNLQELKDRKDPDSIKFVAKELEAVFAYEMIKAMRQTTETFSKGGFSINSYMTMFDMEIARLFAERGLGLQETLIRELNNRINKTERKVKTVDDLQNINRALEKVESEDIIKPLLPANGTISSYFGMREHPILGERRFHYGIDIAAPEGTEIFAIRKGKVIFSGEREGYGNIVIIDHGDGLESRYAHNKVNLVSEGDIVEENTIIAKVGSTGTSTGPHLHFEIRYNGEPTNPMNFLAKR